MSPQRTWPSTTPDGDQQDEGVGKGHQVCEGAGVETGVRRTVINLCEEQDLDREDDLDQETEEEKEALVKGGEHVQEVQQPDQYGGVDHSEVDWSQ